MHENLPTQKGVIYKRKGTNCYELRYGFEDTKLFGKFMYKNLEKDSLYLKRKHDIFKRILKHTKTK